MSAALLGLGACGEDEGGSPDTGADSSSSSGETSAESAPGTGPTTDSSTASSTSGASSGQDTTATGSSESDSSGSTGSGEDVQKVEMRVDGFQVPATETYYACFEFSFQLDALGHIIRFDPIIDNAAHVHHFVLTRVDGPSGQQDGYSCFDLDGDIIWAWAPGQGTFELPEEAGFLVGDTPGGEVTLRLQVHYNNPLQTTGELDNSGFDMWVTNDLRPNSAGTLVFGDVLGINIPAGEPAYEHIMTCRSEVTADRFEGPINVFGTTMHAHEIGSVLYSEVWRDGELLMEMNRDDPYLFDSQHIKFIDEVLQPGDEIRNHCIYDSTGRSNTTVGGPGTQDEMCWNTIMYYPRISNGFDYCSSAN